MGKYVFLYRHTGEMGETPADEAAVMAAWMSWFGSLGDSVVDGGSPFGETGAVASDGTASTGLSSGLGGYSIITADDLASAQAKTKGCPVLLDGGSVEIYEAVPMG